ncbi:WbqC family protein [Sterolibacterium denitrificans]|nr:WbqC family protein [Sterolibacterium denitrificans]
MQPYLFPYLGYFQLIRAVDAFVIYDDVDFIKGGWINRNYILGHADKQLVTLPLQGASPNKRINQLEVSARHKLLQTIRQCYGKAPHFAAVYPVLMDIFSQQTSQLALLLEYQLRSICAYLGLQPKWFVSSAMEKAAGLRGQGKILDICDVLGATRYINLPGGKSLYDREAFAERGLQLSFLQPGAVCYRQFGRKFVPGLSIVDVMMFNDREQCAKLLDAYELV